MTGIVHKLVGKGAFDLILEKLSEAAGRTLTVDEAVYRSEAETGHRNRAIGHLLRNVGAVEGSGRRDPRHLFPPMLDPGDRRATSRAWARRWRMSATIR